MKKALIISGEQGSGKSTLIRAFSEFFKPSFILDLPVTHLLDKGIDENDLDFDLIIIQASFISEIERIIVEFDILSRNNDRPFPNIIIETQINMNLHKHIDANVIYLGAYGNREQAK